jgi:uncharacterized protein DUF6519/parallel beta helix pectate lyase-like protein
MAGDYTRVTFDPHRDHAAVLMQQGRVTLDADWNELVELIDRRLRAETIDIIGRCVVPKETPDGFKIGLGGGTLTIGQGRAYVHGILTECHGADPTVYDPVLGEVHGTEPLAYEKQPYFPNAAAVAPLPTTGTYLAYLDVWRREVTALEEPELVEKAIGIDTATRLQTAWQVRLLEVPDGTTCTADLPAWDDLTAPSAGRLTTAAVGVPVDDDPCTVPPTGGYRGTENRLYRVEIHDPGPLGTATFKWSRDDGSIAFPVTGIDTARTKLTVTRVDRDSVARISIGDWVEVTDDWRELNGLPGELRKVAVVDDGDETITLAAALPAGAFDPLDATRHTRVQRWDESGVAVDAAGGVMQVPVAAGTAIVLEDGVQISFDVDPAAGGFHVGDYWVFAARTADASVEELISAPPRGILHHFCRLAVVTFPDSVIDCRTLWPPDTGGGDGHDCSCAACVTPESHASGTLTIQMAVDQVKSVGGKVCLQPGFYFLDQAVRITGAQSLELEGKGWRTILVSAGREPAIVVQGSLGVTIDSLTVLTSSFTKTGALPAGIAIALRNTIGTVIERCVLAQIGAIRRGGDTTISHAAGTTTGFGIGPQTAGAPLIALDGIVVETLVHENALIGTTGIGAVWGALHGELGFKAMDIGVDERLRSSATAEAARGSGYVLTYDFAVEENLLLCFLTGISLEGFTVNVGDTRIARNSLLGALRAGIVCNGLTLPAMSRVDVLGNMLQVFGFGIAVGTDDTRVADNDLFGLILRGVNVGVEAPTAGTTGFALTSAASTIRRSDAIVLVPSIRPSGIDRCLVRGNRVGRFLGNAISVRTQLVSGQISGNTIQGIGGAGVTTEDGSATALTVSDNQILDVGVLEGSRPGGILLANGIDVAAIGNTIHGVGGSAAAGVMGHDCRRLRIAGNDIGDVGDPDTPEAYGIVGAGGRVDIRDNSVRRVGDPLAKPSLDSTWYGIIVFGEEPKEGKTAAEPAEGLAGFMTAAAALDANRFVVFDPARGRAVVVPRGRSSIAVEGNLVEAVGHENAVYVQTEGSCIFSDNRCFLVTRSNVSVVQIRAGAAIASDNYMEGPEKSAALDLVVGAGRPFTVSGNVSSGPIVLNHTNPLPPPWDQLNVP